MSLLHYVVHLLISLENSDIESWTKFVHYLVDSGYHPVVIPDTDNAFYKMPEIDDAFIFRECAWNMGLRVALYESSYLNFFVPNGCCALAIFNPLCSYICMNLLPPGSTVTTEDAYEAVGHHIGDDYNFATDRQRLCWKTDSFDNIKSAFLRFVSDFPPV